MEQQLRGAANALAGRLNDRESDKVVFAESCTAGLISAALAGVPGISKYLVGSFVTYREAAKQTMLQIPADLLQQHTAVSSEVTKLMATNSLARIEEATWSTAITGHLGPGVDKEIDGKIFVAIASRVAGDSSKGTETIALLSCEMFQLTAADRLDRQREAAGIAIEQLNQALASTE